MLKIGIAIVSILLVTGCTTAATTSSLKEDAEPTLQKMQRKILEASATSPTEAHKNKTA